MNMRRKLLLINPANKVRKGFIYDQGTRFMPLGLGIVAALTPAPWEVELLDESFEEFTFKPADLVAFTSFTSNAPRAYEIAALYRKAGIHTVMGGIHASMYTEEVVNYIDTVVTGEAEGAWPQLISDFESGKIKSLYEGGITDPNDWTGNGQPETWTVIDRAFTKAERALHPQRGGQHRRYGHPTRTGDLVVFSYPPYQFDAATPGTLVARSAFFGQHGYVPDVQEFR